MAVTKKKRKAPDRFTTQEGPMVRPTGEATGVLTAKELAELKRKKKVGAKKKS